MTDNDRGVMTTHRDADVGGLVQDVSGRRLTPEPAGGATPPSPQAVLARGAHQAHGGAR